MKISVIVVAISCFSAIEAARKAEYDFEKQVTQVNEGEMKSCIEGLGLHVSFFVEILSELQSTVQTVLKINNDTLMEMRKCYRDTVPQQLRFGRGRNHFNKQCLKDIPGVEDKHRQRLNRIINYFNLFVKDTAGDKKKARKVFICMRLYSEDSLFNLNSAQRKCIDDKGLESFKFLEILAKSQRDYRRLKLTKEESAAIGECIKKIEPEQVDFNPNADIFDQECLKNYPSVKAKADQYNEDIKKYNQEVLNIAGGHFTLARVVLKCMKDNKKPSPQSGESG